MNICVYGASSERLHNGYMTATENFGKELAKKGHNLIFGAGKYGLMGAVARGAVAGNCKNIIGIVPEFFKSKDVLFDKCTEIVFTKTMRERKQYMEDHSDAFVMVPGGIGTYDEFFEMITLKQLGQHKKPIIIYNINHFFDPMFKMLENAVNQDFMTDHCFNLFSVCDTQEEVFNQLENYIPFSYDKYNS